MIQNVYFYDSYVSVMSSYRDKMASMFSEIRHMKPAILDVKKLKKITTTKNGKDVAKKKTSFSRQKNENCTDTK